MIKIDPYEFITEGGFDAKITSLLKDDSDCFSGEVKIPTLGTIYVQWDIYGTAKKNDPKCNFDPSSNEFKKFKKRLRI